MKALFWVTLKTVDSEHDRFETVIYSSDEEKDLPVDFYAFVLSKKQEIKKNSIMINGGIIK